MRVRTSQVGRRRSLEVEEEAHSRAARPQAAPGGGRAGRRGFYPGGRKETRARRLGISEATFHRWRNQYGGMKADAMKRLKALEKENARFKKLLAEKELDMLKEVNRGHF